MQNKKNNEIEKLAKELLKKMSLDEKIGQLFQSAPPQADVQGLEWEKEYDIYSYIREGKVGSILSLSGSKDIKKLQKLAVEESPNGIPLFFGYDIVHGCKTIFPINLAMACSFDTELIAASAKVMAKESRALGINLTYAPMSDLVRDPRWGRVMESNGEDPYLNAELSRAYVCGFQGDDLSSETAIGACVKHFAGYGAAEAGKEYNSVDMSERHLRQYYLDSYKACIDVGVASVMTAFNIFDGVPATASEFLLRGILKDEWSYDGFVISDYTSTFEMIDHKFCQDTKDVAKKSIEAGLDHEMVSMTYLDHLKELVESGEVKEELIDEATMRVLEFKFKLGLFDDPYKGLVDDATPLLLTKESRELARRVAAESVTLLKNDDNLLPLKAGSKIALLGPLGESKEVMGAWSGLGENKDCVSLSSALTDKNITFQAEKACSIIGDDYWNLERALEVAKNSDVIVLALGESQDMSGESKSRGYLSIPGRQLELVRELKKLAKPMVGIVFSGRPLELLELSQSVDAILQGWFLGSESGNALVDILFGAKNPSGKLAMTFPYALGQVPIYYNAYNTGRPSFTNEPGDIYRSGYIDIPNYPLYPFGYGLSYSTFVYGKPRLAKTSYHGDEEMRVEVSVTNTSAVTGTEVVQLYIGCESFSVVRPLKELKAFKKIEIEARQSIKVNFTLTKEDLAYYNKDLEKIAESGNYNIFIGTNSSDTQKISFQYTK